MVSGVEGAAAAAGAFDVSRALVTILKGTWQLHLQPSQLETLQMRRFAPTLVGQWSTSGVRAFPAALCHKMHAQAYTIWPQPAEFTQIPQHLPGRRSCVLEYTCRGGAHLRSSEHTYSHANTRIFFLQNSSHCSESFKACGFVHKSFILFLFF